MFKMKSNTSQIANWCLCCRLPCLVALGTFRAQRSSQLQSISPCTSEVVQGVFGQCTSKVVQGVFGQCTSKVVQRVFGQYKAQVEKSIFGYNVQNSSQLQSISSSTSDAVLGVFGQCTSKVVHGVFGQCNAQAAKLLLGIMFKIHRNVTMDEGW